VQYSSHNITIERKNEFETVEDRQDSWQGGQASCGAVKAMQASREARHGGGAVVFIVGSTRRIRIVID